MFVCIYFIGEILLAQHSQRIVIHEFINSSGGLSTLCPCVTTLSHYNTDIRESILIIFWHKCYWESRQSKVALFSHLT